MTDANACPVEVRKIWDRAPHNAMTDLIRFDNRWICVFREGEDHISPDGRVRILRSGDGVEWDSAAVVGVPGLDLRDPKITRTPSGRLMLNAAAAYPSGAPQRHRSFVWFSGDGTAWSAPEIIGDPNIWLWRVSWHKDLAYGIGYRTVEPFGIRLYRSPDGLRYAVVADRIFTEDFPNEASMVFGKDATALCLLRRDAGKATARLGLSRPPYTDWTWKDLGARIGGPNMIRMPDGRLLAAVRRYGKTPWTSLDWIDAEEGKMTQFLALPSGGDTSYAGLCLHEKALWVSYYSSHEGRASVYIAKVGLPQ
jgi:hypothetical protein